MSTYPSTSPSSSSPSPRVDPRAEAAGGGPRLTVLVTGATGYVGSRLVPELVGEGHRVLAATRTRGRVDDFPWADDVETRELDVTDDAQVAAAVAGVDAVVYLVHSMESDDFATEDLEAAERMARACEQASVGRVVYLSGLVPDEPEAELSEHLRSRLQVEEVFLASTVPATVLRAAMVIGAGSTSFELLRRLSERVPRFTPVPAWMRSRLQPVAVEDVVHVVARALDQDPRDRHYDVGGDDVMTYPELLGTFAEVAGLRRTRFLVPFVPRALVARACARISGLDVPTVDALVDSLSHEMVCREDDVRHDLLEPGYPFVPVAEALRRSMEPRRGPHHEGTDDEGDVQAPAATDPA